MAKTKTKNKKYTEVTVKEGKGGALSYKTQVIKVGGKSYNPTIKTEKKKNKKGKVTKTTYLKVAGIKYDISGMNQKQVNAVVKKIKSQIKDAQKAGYTIKTDKKGKVTYITNKGVSSLDTSSIESSLSSSVKKMVADNINVEGMPYQFLPSVDPRYVVSGKNTSAYGRKFAEKVIARMPLVFFTPVKPVFMDDFKKSDVTTALQSLVMGTSLDQSLLEGSGRYYSVKFDYKTYYKYLNTMLGCISKYLGIGDEYYTIPGKGAKKIKTIQWQDDSSDAFKTFYSSAENVVFYADGLNQVTETFSNETMESSIASTINGFADQMKEINQLVGGAAKSAVEMAGDVTSKITGALEPIVSKLGGGILGSLAEYGVDTVLNGGKILFPKLWSNSSHNTSYSINFKLRSPDHDTLSLFINILKPYAKLLAMTMPRTIDGNPNAYNAPFFVKVACKGMINVDMGIISSISFSKGNECQWNDDGIPSEIDVSVEIEDLYTSTIAMSGDNESNIKIVQNTAYMDYLANLSGLNIAQMEIGRKVWMWAYLTDKKVAGLLPSAKTAFDQWVSNIFGNVYELLS